MHDPHHYYLDTNFFIAAMEGEDLACAAFLGEAQAGTVLATTASLAQTELLVKPLARGAPQIVARYEALFSHAKNLQIWPLNASTLRLAATVSAGGALALPDAIHIASAILAGCDIFVSNDRHLHLPSHMTRLALDALSAFTYSARSH